MMYEYQPGEYCKDIQCPQYAGGNFDDKCDECKAFIYYQWLGSNGYRILRIPKRYILPEMIRKLLERLGRLGKSIVRRARRD